MTTLAASLAGCGAVGLLCTRPESALTAAPLGICGSRPAPPPAPAARAPARCGACSGWRGPRARRGRCAAPSRGSTAGAAGMRRTWPSTSRRCCRTALRAPARDSLTPPSDGGRAHCVAPCALVYARADATRALSTRTMQGCSAAQRRHAWPYSGIRLTGEVRAAPPSQLRDAVHAAHAVRVSGRRRACHVGGGDEQQAAVADRLHGRVEQVRRRAEGVQVDGLVRGGVLRA